MSSGKNTIQINTLERAVSTDINRLQAFNAKDDAELFARMLIAETSNISPSYNPIPGSHTSLEIVQGFLVRPSGGNFTMTIDGGVLYANAADAGVDDSDYKYVRDPGVLTGVLTFGANASGSIRIDVVEFRVNPVYATVTDNRDIYDPVTGLFTPAVVTKEVKARMEYRIRAGTAGAGFPGVSSGWTPLMIASIPSGAASNNDCTFWDVRPLWEDRVSPRLLTAGASTPQVLELDGNLQRVSATEGRLSGYFRAQLGGRYLEGRFEKCVPGAATTGLNVLEAANQDGGPYAEPLGQTNYFVYACTPFNLPRWAIYAKTPGGLPTTTKGLLVVSATPSLSDGYAGTAITLPTSTGLGTVAQFQECVCVCAFSRSASSFISEHFMRGREITSDVSRTLATQISATAHTGTTVDWTNISTIHFPPGCKAIRVRVTIRFTADTTCVSAGSSLLEVYDTATVGNDISERINGIFAAFTNGSGGTTPFTFTFETWINNPNNLPTPSRANPIAMRFTSGMTASSGTIAVDTANLVDHYFVVTGFRF